jgi:hypothetical protein
MAKTTVGGLDASTSRHQADLQDLPDFCSRPACRREFRRVVSPGRRQAYCSETCRRNAEKELRQAKSRLAHFEELVKMLRSDVAGFGRAADDDDQSSQPLTDQLHAAESALRRVGGVLVFADASQPAVQELRRLYEAIAPLILAEEIAS